MATLSPASAWAHTPYTAAFCEVNPCAKKAPITPVSKSPIPAVAIPGLPPLHTKH